MSCKPDSPDWHQAADNTIVCHCKQITKASIVKAIQAGCDDLEAVQNTTQAGIGNRCKELNPLGVCCHKDIKELITINSKNPADTASCGCCCGE